MQIRYKSYIGVATFLYTLYIRLIICHKINNLMGTNYAVWCMSHVIYIHNFLLSDQSECYILFVSINIVNKQEIVDILTNFTKFEE